VDAGSVRWRYPVQDPSLYAGEVLRLVLAERGVAVARKRIQRGAVPDDAKLLATHVSPSVAEASRSINKLSNNFMAEQILKDLDPVTPATFAGGIARVAGWLAQIGVTTAGLRLGNGSGLYDANRVSARQIVQVLRYCHRDFRIASDFLASLAVMGSDGTTASRLATSDARRWIRAKTGTLDGISALSGYAGTLGRAPIAFAVLINGLAPGHAAAAREAQDRIAELLARHAGRSAAAPATHGPGSIPP
jgi:D-alanyl-D-alanine carboxypeptidase/D-alanyl-D-alanine-endopeptidase (penicillin-binding protein 4)